jgi:hypothetical protein
VADRCAGISAVDCSTGIPALSLVVIAVPFP